MNLSAALRKKRVLLPLLSLTLLAAAAVIAILRSDASKIIVYNLTGTNLPPLRVAACGQIHTFPAMADENSFRWKLAARGSGSEIELELATEPAWVWKGGYVEPRGGFRVTLRLWPDGQVEVHRQISWWQRVVRGAPNLAE